MSEISDDTMNDAMDDIEEGAKVSQDPVCEVAR